MESGDPDKLMIYQAERFNLSKRQDNKFRTNSFNLYGSKNENRK